MPDLPVRYLPDATDFTDLVQFPHGRKPGSAVCPACKGYGGWNLRRDAYGPGQHFQASCFQCRGHGWVDFDSLSAVCVHSFGEVARESQEWDVDIPSYDACWHAVQCKKCGFITTFDSSD